MPSLTSLFKKAPRAIKQNDEEWAVVERHLTIRLNGLLMRVNTLDEGIAYMERFGTKYIRDIEIDREVRNNLYNMAKIEAEELAKIAEMRNIL
jgi:hypothetical protein